MNIVNMFIQKRGANKGPTALGQVALWIGILALTGCQGLKRTENAVPSPPLNNRLEDAAQSITQQLADWQENRTPVVSSVAPSLKGPGGDTASEHLQALVSTDWAGPVEPLLDSVARGWGGKFQALGKAPAIPIVVHLRARKMPLSDFLLALEAQLQRRAHCVVYPDKKLIQLHYRS